MAVATLTSKGRITAPVEIRRRLGLRPSDQLDFVVDDSGDVRIVAKKGRLQDLLGKLRRPGRVISFQAMNEAAADAAAEDWYRVSGKESP